MYWLNSNNGNTIPSSRWPDTLDYTFANETTSRDACAAAKITMAGESMAEMQLVWLSCSSDRVNNYLCERSDPNHGIEIHLYYRSQYIIYNIRVDLIG